MPTDHIPIPLMRSLTMNKRQNQKYRKLRETIEMMRILKEQTDELSRELQNNMTRIGWLLKENTSLISRFPVKVEDFATRPPIHNGQYVIWFVRKDRTAVRFYTLKGDRWFDSQNNEVNIRDLYPSCYLQVPTLEDSVEDLYRRRAER